MFNIILCSGMSGLHKASSGFDVHVLHGLNALKKADIYPSFFEIKSEKICRTVDQVKESKVKKHPTRIENIKVYLSKLEIINIDILFLGTNESFLPVILYLHGAGWFSGNAHR